MRRHERRTPRSGHGGFSADQTISLLLAVGRADARRAGSISRLSQHSLQSRRLAGGAAGAILWGAAAPIAALSAPVGQGPPRLPLDDVHRKRKVIGPGIRGG